MNKVYKYRKVGGGMTPYDIINGKFGDDTLHLRDTTCEHLGPACEIEVVKCDCNSYKFSKALNLTAERYIYFHRGEKFFNNKEDAFIIELQSRLESQHKDIANNEKQIENNKLALENLKINQVNYLNIENAKLGTKCYLENDGWCRIIGIIQFENNKKGFLTDNNYSNGYDDSYGDRIILIENETDGNIITEGGCAVFVSSDDFNNLKNNNKISKLNKHIDKCKISIEKSIKLIEKINSIINKNLTFEEMLDMYMTK